MQVTTPFRIDLIFKDTTNIFDLQAFKPNAYTLSFLEDLIYTHGNPIGFKLKYLNVPTNTPKFINWLQTDFKELFEYDPIMWFAGVGTMPVELHQYLLPFYQEPKESQCHILGPNSN